MLSLALGVMFWWEWKKNSTHFLQSIFTCVSVPSPQESANTCPLLVSQAFHTPTCTACLPSSLLTDDTRMTTWSRDWPLLPHWTLCSQGQGRSPTHPRILRAPQRAWNLPSTQCGTVCSPPLRVDVRVLRLWLRWEMGSLQRSWR